MVDGRSVLKQAQIDILDLVYKYRFVSRELVADSLGLSVNTTLYKKFEVFVKHGLVGKRLEPRMRLLGTPAAYYLTAKGLRTLQALPDHEYINDKVIKGSYRNKSVKQSFVNHTLAIYKYTNILRRKYPSLKVFTKPEMSQFSYFPNQLPDAFLSLPTKDSPNRYFFDVIPVGTPRRAIDGKLLSYCNFFNEGGWDVTASEWPVILLVAGNYRAERQLQYIARARLDREDLGHLRVFTSTLQALSHMDDEALVWTRVSDTDEPLALTTLLD